MMEKRDKNIVDLIEKCDNCKLCECINCEISWEEVQEIKKLMVRVTKLEFTVNERLEELKKERELYKKRWETIDKLHPTLIRIDAQIEILQKILEEWWNV